jgi:hypothetical protein
MCAKQPGRREMAESGRSALEREGLKAAVAWGLRLPTPPSLDGSRDSRRSPPARSGEAPNKARGRNCTKPGGRTTFEAVTDDQHPDHQLRIDRRSARITVERLQQVILPAYRNSYRPRCRMCRRDCDLCSMKARQAREGRRVQHYWRGDLPAGNTAPRLPGSLCNP